MIYALRIAALPLLVAAAVALAAFPPPAGAQSLLSAPPENLLMEGEVEESPLPGIGEEVLSTSPGEPGEGEESAAFEGAAALEGAAEQEEGEQEGGQEGDPADEVVEEAGEDESPWTSWWKGTTEDSGEAGAEETGEEAAEPPEPEQLVEMVESGEGSRAYPFLLQRWEELRLSPATGEEEKETARSIHIYLLKAGEGHAPEAGVEALAREFTELYPDDEWFPWAYFYLNQALFQQEKPLEESFFFDDQALQSLPGWMQTSLLRMRSAQALRNGDPLTAAGLLMRELNSESTLRQSAPEDIIDLIGQAADVGQLENFVAEHAEADWLEEHLPFLKTRILINRGDFPGALLAMDDINREGLADTAARIKFIHAASAEIEKRVLTSPGRVGVLLPLSSSSATLRRLAQNTLDGLRLAVSQGRPDKYGNVVSTRNGARNGAGSGARNRAEENLLRRTGRELQPPLERADGRRDSRKAELELLVRDTANNPGRAAEMVEELVRKEHVIAIIGPIARNESAAAAARADSLGVPLISLSLTLPLPPGSRYIFRHSKNQSEEIRDLVRYAMDYSGARRFTILYPLGGYGNTMADLFWEEVTKRGGTVVGIESYRSWRGGNIEPGREVEFKEVFDRFTGMKRPQEPIDLELMELLGENRPDPIVDFDALFVPIGPNGSHDLRLIAPYLATVDAEEVLLLGSRFWNSDSAVVAGAGRLNNSVFVDAYQRRGGSPAVRSFRRRHLAMFGHRSGYRPASYYTALGYDTLRMVEKLVREKNVRSPEVLAKELKEMDSYQGITGLTTFLGSGEAVKESMFFTLSGEVIRRINP